MINYTLDEANSVLHIRPVGPLRKDDFEILSRAVDPFIQRTGGLNGLLLETARFPGWENMAAVVRHFRFVRDHHRKVKKVAVITDSPLGKMAEHVASHFLAPTIKQFPSGQLEEAKKWATSN